VAVATWRKPKGSAKAIAAFCAGGCRSSTSLTPLAFMAQERSSLSGWVDGKACDVKGMKVSGFLQSECVLKYVHTYCYIHRYVFPPMYICMCVLFGNKAHHMYCSFIMDTYS
jgi:hypothetical protein